MTKGRHPYVGSGLAQVLAAAVVVAGIVLAGAGVAVVAMVVLAEVLKTGRAVFKTGLAAETQANSVRMNNILITKKQKKLPWASYNGIPRDLALSSQGVASSCVCLRRLVEAIVVLMDPELIWF